MDDKRFATPANSSIFSRCIPRRDCHLGTSHKGIRSQSRSRVDYPNCQAVDTNKSVAIVTMNSSAIHPENRNRRKDIRVWNQSFPSPRWAVNPRLVEPHLPHGLKSEFSVLLDRLPARANELYLPIFICFFSRDRARGADGCYALLKGNPCFCPGLLISIFAANLHIWRPFPYPQPGDPVDGCWLHRTTTWGPGGAWIF